MDIRLVIVRGAKGRPTFPMRSNELIIGRQKGCGLRVPSATVSRQHCRLRLVNGALQAEDLGSANGTLLNGQPLRRPTSLSPGDELSVGPVTLVVEFQGRTAPARPAAPPLQRSDFEVVMAEALDDEDTEPTTALADSDEPLPILPEDTGEDELLAQMDDENSQPLDLPEGEELRSLLSQLEDPSVKQNRKKR